MKKRLRITSILLSIATLCTVAVRAEENSSAYVSETVKQLLTTLNIMSESDINNSGYVTRAYAAKTVVNMISGANIGTASGSMFIDVPSEMLYAAEIETAAFNKLVYGVGDGLYKPDDIITDDNMAVILLRYAGYDKFSIDNSVKSKLLKNVNAADALSYTDLANMLYNVLNLNVVYLKEINKSGNSYGIDTDTTILNENFKVYMKDGLVIQNGFTAFFSGTDVKRNEIMLQSGSDKIVMQIGATDIDKMIGRYVRIFYNSDRREDKYVCLSYEAQSGNNRTEEISIIDIDYSISNSTTLAYLSGEKTKKLSISSTPAVIYNGSYYCDAGGFKIANLSGKEGKITAIDNDGDNTYDVLVVEAYEVFVIQNVILTDKIVIKDDGSGLAGGISFNEDDYDSFSLYNLDGTRGNIEDLEKGMVLSVAKNCNSSDNKIIKIIISDNKESGTVTSIGTDDFGRNFVEIDSDQKYYFLGPVPTNISVGQPTEIILSAENNAVGASADAVYEKPIGIITKYKYDRKNDALVINMITANNKREEFTVTNKIKIDGVTERDMQTAYTLLQTAATDADSKIDFVDGTDVYYVKVGIFPVRYRLRDNGELAELDSPYQNTAAGEGTDTLRKFDNDKYFYENNVVGAKYSLKDSAQAFLINATPASGGVISAEWVEDSMFSTLSTVDSVMSRGRDFICTYKLDNNDMYADFVVKFKPWGAKADSGPLLMLEKITGVYDEVQEENTYHIEGLEGNVRKSYVISGLYKESFEDLTSASSMPTRGSLLRLALDEYGNVIHIKTITELNRTASESTSEIEAKNINDGETAINKIRGDRGKNDYVFYGYPIRRDGNIVELKRKNFISGTVKVTGVGDKATTMADTSLDTVLAYIPSNAAVFVYDIDNNEIYAGTYDDIYDYNSSGSRCSYVGLIFGSGKVTTVIIYNYSALKK